MGWRWTVGIIWLSFREAGAGGLLSVVLRSVFVWGRSGWVQALALCVRRRGQRG